MELCRDEKDTPHPLLGIMGSINDPDADLKAIIKSQSDKLNRLTEEHKDLLDKCDTLQMIIREFAIRLELIEERQGDEIVSRMNPADLIELKGYDKNVTTTLMYLEKRKIIFVRDLKRLGIVFRFDKQYIRFLQKIGHLPGNAVKQAQNGLWYVIKIEEGE